MVHQGRRRSLVTIGLPEVRWRNMTSGSNRPQDTPESNATRLLTSSLTKAPLATPPQIAWNRNPPPVGYGPSSGTFATLPVRNGGTRCPPSSLQNSTYAGPPSTGGSPSEHLQRFYPSACRLLIHHRRAASSIIPKTSIAPVISGLNAAPKTQCLLSRFAACSLQRILHPDWTQTSRHLWQQVGQQGQ
jgi:hypothetical protein